MHLAPLPPSRLDDAWPFLADRFREIADGSQGRIDENYLYAAIRKGEYLTWVVMDGNVQKAVVLAKIIQFPLKRILKIVACVGEDYREWIGLIEEIERWAQEGGFHQIEITARPGWSKAIDYKITHYVMVKEL